MDFFDNYDFNFKLVAQNVLYIMFNYNGSQSSVQPQKGYNYMFVGYRNWLEGARQSAGCSQELQQYLYFLSYYCLKLCKFLLPTTIHNVESSDVSIFSSAL